jgi:release factor glutamine methyltransferase
MKTILEVLNGSTEYLGKHAIENPRLNAEHLLAHALKKKRLELYLAFDCPLPEADLSAMRDLLRERGAGKPLQHLLGTAEFFGREFLCDSRALVPRPETEQLVEKFLEKERAASSVLETGIGSGVISVTLALECPGMQISATDISPQALDLARTNAERLGVLDRIQFHQADLVPDADAPYACIIANLPYIPMEEISTLSREVKHDPLGALDGGADGMDILRRLVAKCPDCLVPGGRIYLEIGARQGIPLAEALEREKFRDIQLHTDYQGKERFLSATYG